MKIFLIIASLTATFSCLANQYNPYMPYERPKVLVEANINPIEAGMSDSSEFVDEDGNALSFNSNNMVFIMEIDGTEVYLDKETGTYVNKTSESDDNK